MKTSVLILGAKGMLGGALARLFTSLNEYETTLWDKEDIDISRTEDLRQKIVDLWPDVIINAAAYNNVDLCEEDSAQYRLAQSINAVAPGELAQISAGLRSLFIHFSSDYVFDGSRPRYDSPSGRPDDCCGEKCPGCQYLGAKETLEYFAYRENDLPNPISRYGQTKLAGERAVAEKGSEYLIIRLSKLFGAPAQAEGAKRSFFDIMLEVAERQDLIKAVESETSCFTYAPDLAAATERLIRHRPRSGVYHLVNEGAVTWYGAVRELYSLAGVKKTVEPVSPEEFPRPAKRPSSSVLLNTKLPSDLAPLRPWTEALREYLAETGRLS
ncbi:MAG TPA: NAD(P)-dependent oxidoreductase [Candidatus Moranbacteria bacterium]|nr:NAD(P)-dependent oxidoreductase [Candidatus Moranbacteria bacterium]